MDDDEMPLVVTQIKAAAARRLRMKRQMSIAKEYLLTNKQDSEKVSKQDSEKVSKHDSETVFKQDSEKVSKQDSENQSFQTETILDEYPQAPKNQDERISSTENERILRKQIP